MNVHRGWLRSVSRSLRCVGTVTCCGALLACTAPASLAVPPSPATPPAPATAPSLATPPAPGDTAPSLATPPAPGDTAPSPGSVAPSPVGLASVDWSRAVRDCSLAGGGSGLGTVVDGVQDADVTGDGRADALVVTRCDSPTSSWPQEVEVFDGASPRLQPVRIAALLADDPDYPRDVRVTVAGRRIVIDATGLSEDAPTCCPDLLLHRVFAWTGTTFTLTDSTTTHR